MGLVIDSGVFVHWERSGREINFSPWAGYGDVAISAITVSELLVGVHRADTEKRRQRRAAFVEAILAQVPVVDFTTDVARVHSQRLATLMRQGQMVGAHDLLIAATALHRQSAVLTTNVDEFARVPDLEVIPFREPSGEA